MDLLFEIFKCLMVKSDEKEVIGGPKIDIQPKRSETHFLVWLRSWPLPRRASSIVGIKRWATNDNVIEM